MLSTVYLPAVAAAGTAFGESGLLREGALDHLQRHRRITAADVVERMTLRSASVREATLLVLDRGASMLASLLVVRNSGRQSLLVVEQYVSRALELADYVYVLRKGRVDLVAEPAELGRDAILESYLGSHT